VVRLTLRASRRGARVTPAIGASGRALIQRCKLDNCVYVIWTYVHNLL
jgi:hypothetical protein